MTKNRKRKAKTETFAQIVFRQFAEEGEVTGLGALADWYDEQGQKPELASLLRSVLAGERDSEAVQFFWQNAGWGYDPKKETAEEGRFRVACSLADAEEWLEEQGEEGRVIWEEDETADRSWMDDDDGRTLWGCDVVVEVDGKEYDAGCGGIDFGPDDDPYTGHPYGRVMVAELASEVKERIETDRANVEFYREHTGDYCCIWPATWNTSVWDGRAAAIIGNPASVHSTNISRQFIEERCRKVERVKVPAKWLKALIGEDNQ
jgi:GNAT superfamily N-acetyltransferase